MRPADSYPDESRDALAAFLSEAVARLDDVLRLAPKNRFQEVDEAERAIVRLRDAGNDEVLQRQGPAGFAPGFHLLGFQVERLPLLAERADD